MRQRRKKLIEWVVARHHAFTRLYLELFPYDVLCLETTYAHYALGMPLR